MTRKQPSARLRARLEARRLASRRLRAEVTAGHLDRAKRLSGSDWRTAKLIDVPPQHVSDFRAGRRMIDPASAIKLANLIGEPLIPALALALAFTAKSKRNRNLWLDYAAARWPERPRFLDSWASGRFKSEYPKR